MSHNNARIPTKDGDKNNYYTIVTPYINQVANQSRFNTPVLVLGKLNTNYAL